jgi:hypothetical protein
MPRRCRCIYLRAHPGTQRLPSRLCRTTPRESTPSSRATRFPLSHKSRNWLLQVRHYGEPKPDLFSLTSDPLPGDLTTRTIHAPVGSSQAPIAKNRYDWVGTALESQKVGYAHRPCRQVGSASASLHKQDAGPSKWLMVVVDFADKPARIVTAYGRGHGKPPPGWRSL